MYVNLNKKLNTGVVLKKLSKRIRNVSQSYQSVKSKSKECMDLNRNSDMSGPHILKECNVYIIIIIIVIHSKDPPLVCLTCLCCTGYTIELSDLPRDFRAPLFGS